MKEIKKYMEELGWRLVDDVEVEGKDRKPIGIRKEYWKGNPCVWGNALTIKNAQSFLDHEKRAALEAAISTLKLVRDLGPMLDLDREIAERERDLSRLKGDK